MTQRRDPTGASHSRKWQRRPEYKKDPSQHGAVASAQYAMTLEEIAQAMNITRERVRQIETKALRKLKFALHTRGIDPHDFFPD